MIKKHIKKIIFFTLSIIIFVIFALSNKSNVSVEIFSIKEEFTIWILVLYSILIGVFTTLLFILPSVLILKLNYRRLKERFETLSDSKLTEIIKDNDEIIE